MNAELKNKVFKEWLDQYYEFGARIAFRILGSESESRDVVQEAYLRVWLKMENYDSRQKFSTWLFRIISNLCFDILRKRKRVLKYINSSDAGSISNDDPEEFAEEEIVRNLVQTLSEKLSPRQKIVFVMRDLEGMEIEDVCGITGMNKDQVKANLYLARKEIHKNLVQLKVLEEKI